MKQRLCILFLILLTAFLLAGCGKAETHTVSPAFTADTASEATPTPAPIAAEDPSEEPVEEPWEEGYDGPEEGVDIMQDFVIELGEDEVFVIN